MFVFAAGAAVTGLVAPRSHRHFDSVSPVSFFGPLDHDVILSRDASKPYKDGLGTGVYVINRVIAGDVNTRIQGFF
jgi:hypothetical protein